MKYLIVTIFLISSSQLFAEQKITNSISTAQQINLYQRESAQSWFNNQSQIITGLTSSDDRVKFNSQERMFFELPAYGILTINDFSKLEEIKKKYRAEAKKLPPKSSIKERRELLKKHSAELNTVKSEASNRLLNLGQTGSNLYKPKSKGINKNSLLKSSTLGSIKSTKDFTCHPADNYKFCTSPEGKKYKKIGDSDLGNRLEEKVKIQYLKEGQSPSTDGGGALPN
jgi:hypothetical protein